jgi:hypothetical protein
MALGMRHLRDSNGTWIVFWPTRFLDGKEVMVGWHTIAAILPPELPGAGATIVLSGGSTLHVLETPQEIEDELFNSF